ncbi:MAG TPA: GTP-binding protein [Niabella sp.]|nr:GTP-binding protein [Niabella sp.]
MQTFDQKHIKNIAFVGAKNSGKTTLTESMIFEAGLITRRGSIEEGNTVSDCHRLEKERNMSVFTTLVHTEWRNYKINILDTPGLDDFIGEIVQGVKAADTIVMVINAQHGVEPKLYGTILTSLVNPLFLPSTRLTIPMPILTNHWLRSKNITVTTWCKFNIHIIIMVI